jgi:DNA-binding transcriptional LysR family regulator
MSSDTRGNLDLNLLLVFDAVMAEGSVKHAAARLNMNPPAVSQALSRLKDTLGAELFIRSGHGLRPTPRASKMWPSVRKALGLIDAVVVDGDVFDPATARSTMMLDLPAGLDGLITPKLAGRVAAAPGLQFRVASARAVNVLNDLRYGESWLACDYRPVNEPGFRCETLTEQDYVLLARKAHPGLKAGLTAALYQTLPQVTVSAIRATSVLPVNERLEALSISRIVKFNVPGLLSIIEIVSTLDLVTTLPRCVGTYVQQWANIEIHELPFKLPPVSFYMVWHERFDGDPAHIWLRQTIREIGAEL